MRNLLFLLLFSFAAYGNQPWDKLALVKLTYSEFQRVLDKPELMLEEPYLSKSFQWFDNRAELDAILKSPEFEPGNYVLVSISNDNLVIDGFVRPIFYAQHAFVGKQAFVFFNDEFGNPAPRVSPTMKRWLSVWHNDEINAYRIPILNSNRTLRLREDSIHHQWLVKYQRNYSDYYDDYSRRNTIPPPNKGFVVASQPVYRHGDTLKIKALLFGEYDSFLDEPISIVIQPAYGTDFIRSRYREITLVNNLSPIRRGVYEFQTVLGDTLPSNQLYQIKIYHKPKNERIPQSSKNWISHFEIEDYQLRENEVNLTADKNSLYPGDDLTLVLETKDGVGNPIAGAKSTFSVLMCCLNIPEKHINFSFPDTLAFGTIPADYNGVSSLHLHDSLFDFPVDYSITVRVRTELPDGEIVIRTMKIRRLLQSNPLAMERRFENMCAFLHTGDTALAIMETTYNNITIRDTILLPYCFPSDPMAKSYRVIYQQFERNYTNTLIQNPIQHTATQTENGLEIKLENPYKMDATAFFQIGKKEHSSFRFSSDTTLYFEIKPYQVVYLDLTYINRGNLVQELHSFRQKDKTLHISHNFPEVSLPGKSDTAKINISNYRNTQAMENVDVTVVSFSNHYRIDYTPSLGYYGYTAPENQKSAQIFVQDDHPSFTHYSPISPEWAEKFNLHGKLYYDLLLNPNSKDYHFIPLEDSLATPQMAVFPVRQGRFEKPIYFSVNGVPHYFYRAEYAAYSFPIAAREKNLVKVRLYDNEYLLSVPTIQGYKTVVSFEAWRPPKPKPLSPSEKKLLASSYLQMQTTGVAISSASRFIPNYRTPAIYGPFRNERITLFNRQRDSLRMTFVAGHDYKINFNDRVIFLEPNSLISSVPINQHPIRFGSSVKPFEVYDHQRDSTLFFRSVYVHPLQRKLQEISVKRPNPSLEIGSAGLHIYLVDDDQIKRNFVDYVIIIPHDDEHDNRINIIANNFSSRKLKAGKYTIYALKFSHGRIKVYKAETRLTEGLNTMVGLTPFMPKGDEFVDQINDLLQFDNSEFNMEISSEQIGYQQSTRDQSNFNVLLIGKVVDEEGKPIGFATISAYRNGELVSVVDADIDGAYRLGVPDEGLYDIKTSFIGFNTVLMKDVMVTQRSIVNFKLREDATALAEVMIMNYEKPLVTTEAKTTVTAREVESMAVRDISPIAAQSAGVYFIDGVKVRGDLSLPQASISQIEIGGLPGQFGDDDKPSTPPQMSPLALDFEASGMRSNFSDAAIWQPNLETNGDGEVSFRYQLPDDITTWRTHILAMDEKLNTGQTTVYTKAFKPLQARLFTPRFAIAGDSILLRGNIQNLTGERYKGDVMWLTNASDTLKTEKYIQRFHDSKEWIYANDNSDSAETFFGLRLINGYEDGEKRSFPVYPRGAEVHTGEGFVSLSDTILTLKQPGGQSTFSLQINEGTADILENEVVYLASYAHQCNEQMASKLLAMSILGVENFKRKQRKEFEKLLSDLAKNQGKNGGWQWWGKLEDDVFFNLNMALEIGARLHRLQATGYENTTMEKMLGKIKENISNWYFQVADSRKDSLEITLLGARIGAVLPYEAIIELTEDENEYFKILRSIIAALSEAEVELENPLSYSKTNIYGQIYWSVHDTLPQPFFGNTKLNILAQELLNLQNAPMNDRMKSLSWILSQRRGRYFFNTVVSSDFSWLLKQYYDSPFQDSDTASVRYKGVEKPLPFSGEFSTGEEIEFDIRVGSAPLFVNYYQTSFEESPDKEHEKMRISTWFLENNQPVEQLGVGQIIEMQIEIEVDERANYLMVEAPIPAGCTYATRQFPTYATHREDFRDRCVLYFENLSPGKHKFTIPLEVRFAGKFYVNPARFGSMYFKQFESFNAGREVEAR
jgi:hypothetical protein